MQKRIALLHYSLPPVVGGVETVIEHQAQELARLGYNVRVISGEGGDLPDPIETHINPLFSSNHPEILSVKADLDAGIVPAHFETLLAGVMSSLDVALADCNICIAHNVPTMHKNLVLTSALRYVARQGHIRLISYVHDLAADNPQYAAELHDGYPWNMIRQAWPRTHYLTISEDRRKMTARLLGIPELMIGVITPGVDSARFFRFTETTRQCIEGWNLMAADGILLTPARMTRRKNIELALHVLAHLRAEFKRDFRLIVTGPPGPHNPANQAYVQRLLEIRTELALKDAAHFLYTDVPRGENYVAPDDVISDFFLLADALLFPSIGEGFGIPILEAGLARLPVFCADIPTLRATAQEDASYFHPTQTAPEAIARQIISSLNDLPAFRLRLRTRQQFRWDHIVREQLKPILEAL